jgi:hypothetical protein
MTAKEMFEILGYGDYFNNGLRITYSNFDKECKMIEFDLKKKQLILADDSEEIFELSLEELQAINKQVEELGWNNGI